MGLLITAVRIGLRSLGYEARIEIYPSTIAVRLRGRRKRLGHIPLPAGLHIKVPRYRPSLRRLLQM